MQSKFIAFCTINDTSDEFVLSENAYGVHESPMNVYRNPKSSKMTEGLYTEHHNFAPLSPKLMIVFRSLYLPSGVDEGDTQERDSMREMIQNMHTDPDGVNYGANSILEDLPVEK